MFLRVYEMHRILGQIRITFGYHMHCSCIGFGEMRMEVVYNMESHAPSSPIDKGLGVINNICRISTLVI
jgi:hypothetical protein